MEADRDIGGALVARVGLNGGFIKVAESVRDVSPGGLNGRDEIGGRVAGRVRPETLRALVIVIGLIAAGFYLTR